MSRWTEVLQEIARRQLPGQPAAAPPARPPAAPASPPPPPPPRPSPPAPPPAARQPAPVLADLVAWLRTVGDVAPGPWVLGTDRYGRPWLTVTDTGRYLANLRLRVDLHLAGPPVPPPWPAVDPACWAAAGTVLADELRRLKDYLEAPRA